MSLGFLHYHYSSPNRNYTNVDFLPLFGSTLVVFDEIPQFR